eukprot:GHVP01041772.1.p1 GENE.GHVP01041772.1~~GHVP01041772.1.p1  ORF type:complete len:1423 (+),score=317.43 GHVP01041772.1:33-4271(+)
MPEAEETKNMMGVKEFQSIAAAISEDCFSFGTEIVTPMGKRKLIYADHAATGQPLKSVESFIQEKVLPKLANAHSTDSLTGWQTTNFREEARSIVRTFYNCNYDDQILFCGTGSSAGIFKFLEIMNAGFWSTSDPLIHPIYEPLTRQQIFKKDRFGAWNCLICQTTLESPSHCRLHEKSDRHAQEFKIFAPSGRKLKRHVILFLDPMTHHSVLLPQRQLAKEILTGESTTVTFEISMVELVSETLEINIRDVKNKLKFIDSLNKFYRMQKDDNYDKQIIPFFFLNATSNVTGMMRCIKKINKVVHELDGYIFWDLAGTSGHHRINMNPSEDPLDSIDAAIASPHKFVGGPDTPGLLMMKSKFVQKDTPTKPAGGTVTWVTDGGQSFRMDFQDKEEAGSQLNVGTVRLGVVYRMHLLLPYDHIERTEYSYLDHLVSLWGRHPRIRLCGPGMLEDLEQKNLRGARVAFVSFMILYGNNPKVIPEGHEKGLYLHFSFIAVLLSDLFGIQTRSGCACAAPWSQRLLGISEELADRINQVVEETGEDCLKYGVCRISLHFSMTWDEIEFIAQAVTWIAEFGWQLLPFYTFDRKAGSWRHRFVSRDNFRQWISELNVGSANGKLELSSAANKETEKIDKKQGHQVFGAKALPGMSLGVAQELASAIASKNLKKVGTSVPKKDSEPRELTELEKALAGQTLKSRVDPSPRKETTKLDRPKPQASEFEKVFAKIRGTTPKSTPAEVANVAEKASTPKSLPIETKKSSTEVKVKPKEAKERKEATVAQDEAKEQATVAQEQAEVAKKAQEEAKEQEKVAQEMAKVAQEQATVAQEQATVAQEHAKLAKEAQEQANVSQDEAKVSQDEAKVSLDEAKVSQEVNEASAKSLHPISMKPKVVSKKSSELTANKALVSQLQAKLLLGKEPSPKVEKKISETISETKADEKSNLKEENASTSDSGFTWKTLRHSAPEDVVEALNLADHYLAFSQSIFARGKIPAAFQFPPALPSHVAPYIWFALPADAVASLSFGKNEERLLDSQIFLPDGETPIRLENAPFKVLQFESTRKALQEKTSAFLELHNEVQGNTEEIKKIANLNILESKEVLSRGFIVLRENWKPDNQTLNEPEKPKLSSLESMDRALESPVEDTSDNSDVLSPGLMNAELTSRELKKGVGKAMRLFSMINEGDKVLVGVSGGKDSLSLLHLLLANKKRTPVNYTIAAATVDPQAPEFEPSCLTAYVESLGIKHHMLSFPIIELAKEKKADSLCAFCSRLRRGLLYSCMKENGYNVLALGHHLDDVVEGFMMSQFNNGSLFHMKANYVTTENGFRVIRPLILCREKQLAAFSSRFNLPIISDNCPACFKAPTQRHKMKLMLAEQEYTNPNLFSSIMRALMPHMKALEALDEAEDKQLDIENFQQSRSA